MSKKSDRSLVEVTFVDGEIKTYEISAGVTIGAFLAKDAGQNRILTLFNEVETYCIPLERIREWIIKVLPGETE